MLNFMKTLRHEVVLSDGAKVKYKTIFSKRRKDFTINCREQC